MSIVTPRPALRRYYTALVASAPFAPVLLVAVLSLVALLGCLAEPPDDAEGPPPAARIVAMWDPLACDQPLRVVIELESDTGARFSRSAPCGIGSATLDVDHWGVFFARAYAWVAGEPRRDEADIAATLAIDAPVVYWQVDVPDRVF